MMTLIGHLRSFHNVQLEIQFYKREAFYTVVKKYD